MTGRNLARWLAPALAVLAVFGPGVGGQTRAPAPTRDYPVQPVPFTAVKLTDGFWAPRIEVNRTATIPVAFEQCERTNRVDLFVRAAQVLRGEKPASLDPPGYPFDDSDVYKVIEGASYTLSVHPDPRLDAYVDTLVAKIAAAQEPDGYLYTTRTINPQKPHPWAGSARWVLERDDSHELYNLGHLFEAAVAHYLATGKRTLLDVAVKAADLLVRTFGPGKRSIWPGHQITEMGLVRLSRVTGNEQYLELAKFLLDERGPGPLPPGERINPRGPEYNQAQQRVVDQTEPVGHAVRAMYMYSGMADVAALTGDETYVKAIDTIWENTVTRKLYLTGGIGASGAGEAFGRAVSAAEHDRLQRDLRVGRHGLLESSPLSAARRREVHRRDGADALQWAHLRRRTRRQNVLLPQPARVARPASAQPVVRRRVLPVEHLAVPRVDPRLCLRETE